MTYHHEPRKPTMNEFLRSRGIQIRMRAPTQAEMLNDRMARFVTNHSQRKTLFQRVLDIVRDNTSYT